MLLMKLARACTGVRTVRESEGEDEGRRRGRRRGRREKEREGEGGEGWMMISPPEMAPNHRLHTES